MAASPKPVPEPDKDLGFGLRVSGEARQRFLNRDGSFNVVREGLSPWQSLSLYHTLLTTTWPRYFSMVAAAYAITNLLFATAFVLCGPDALHGAAGGSIGERFLDAIFFSVQTLATIGYGRVSPAGVTANVLVAVEALVGLLGFALATGFLFARVSRPSARIEFSRVAVVAPYRGSTGLMFRIANQRRNQLIDVAATVSLSRFETVGGVRVRRFHQLNLERRSVVFFPLHWVVVHPIDEASPLWGVPAEEFAASDPEVLVLLTGVDETFSQTVHARSSYKADEIVWGARFKDMFLRREDGRLGIDLRRLHDVENT